MFGKAKLFIYFSILTVIFFFSAAHAQDVLKDSDLDGVSDDKELNVYRTDPNNSDTDGDGFSDLQEILNKTDPLDSKSTPVEIYYKENIKVLERKDPLAWYISRISGITAFILLTFVVCFGLLQTSRALVKIRIMGVLTAQEVHRTIAWAGLFMVILHFMALFFDNYFKLYIIELIVPFTIHRDFRSVLGFDYTYASALGIIAFYTIILLIATSELRKKVISMKAWRAIHYASFAGYLMFLVHGYLSGTDSREPWMRWIYIVSMTMVFSFLLARIFKKRLFLKRPEKKPEQKEDSKIY